MLLLYVYSTKQKSQNKMVTSRLSKRTRVIALAVVVLAVTGGSSAVWLKSRANQDQAPTERTATINYAPATEPEKKQAEDNKDRIVEEQKQTPTSSNSSGSKKSVTPTITSTSGSVKGSVAGIFEEGGTCTATFTKDGTSLSRTSAGFQNVSYTQCAPINFSDNFLSPGTWTVTLNYSSATAEGTSASQTVEVN